MSSSIHFFFSTQKEGPNVKSYHLKLDLHPWYIKFIIAQKFLKHANVEKILTRMKTAVLGKPRALNTERH